MKLPGRDRMVSGVAWLRSRGRPRALILGYHRVGASGEDPHGLSVSTSVFERHLDTLAANAHTVFLSELVDDIEEGAIRSRSVAVTFDDAYANTLRRVEPLLRERGVPATVFVPTGLLGAEPWWDRLARALSSDRRLPAELVVPLEEGRHLRRPLTEVERAATPSGARVALMMDVYRALRLLSERARTEALDALEALSDTSDDSGRRTPDLVVSASELTELDRSDVIEIGSHSVTHPFLSRLPIDAQRSEIEDSRETLGSLLGHSVDLFSYPNGSRDPETDAVVREAGYRGACASGPGVATANSDRFALPRFWPDEDHDSVAHVLGRWL